MIKILSILSTVFYFLLPMVVFASTEVPIRIRIFSDVDDTIKISAVRDFTDSVALSVYQDALFYGMNTVYSSVRKEQVQKGNKIIFSYVTNGIDFTVNQTHRGLLHRYKFPNPNNHYPQNLYEKVKRKAHKFDTITRAIRNDWPDRVVLIGDNAERDPVIYDQIRKAIEKQAAAEGRKIEILTYIHIVYKPSNPKTKGIRPGQQPFHNAGDLAMILYKDNFLSAGQKDYIVDLVKKKIAKEGRNRVWTPLVYPWYKYYNLGALGQSSCQQFYK